MTPIRLLALVIFLAACAEREEPYVANLRRRCARVQREFEKATGHSLGKIEILVLSREELTGLVLPEARATLARIENGPRDEALEAEARSIAEGGAPWCEAYVDARGRILLPEPDEERQSLARFLVELGRGSSSSEDSRLADLMLLREVVRAHQHRDLIRPGFLESARSRSAILARRAVLEGHTEYLSRKLAPALGLADVYDQFYDDRFVTPPPHWKQEWLLEEARISSADYGFANIQGRRFVEAVVDRFGQKDAFRRIFEDPPTLAEVSRPESYGRAREDSNWGPIAEDLRRWLVRERGPTEIEVIALPMVREVAGDAARGFRKGFRLRFSILDVVVHVLMADSDEEARAVHAGWTRGIERMGALTTKAQMLVGMHASRKVNLWVSEALSVSFTACERRVILREGPLVVDVFCRPDSSVEQGAERLAERAAKFLLDSEWRAAWLRGGEEELKSEDAGLRLAAVTRLDRYVPDDDWEVRWMGRHREAADPSKDEEERIGLLIAGLADPDPAGVIRSLRSIRDLRLWYVPLPVLRRMLDSPVPAVRREAWYLAEFRVCPFEDEGEYLPASEAIARIDAALDDGDFVIRANAVECLGDLQGAPGFAAVFRKALSDDSKHIRDSTLSTLTFSSWEFRVPEIGPDLVRMLDESPSHAAEALGELGDAAKGAVPRLRELLGDPEARLPAAEAIRRINGDVEPLFAVVRGSAAEGKPQGIYELIQLGPRARPLLPEIIQALAHENRWTRECAAEALGEIGGEQAVDALLQRLAAETDKQVLLKVRLALARLSRQAGSD